MHDLAIVIPAFKADFLRDTLRSIASQTDQRFRVYVGNDGGSVELERICHQFPALDLVYHRFDDNLGGTSLTRQWDRCVAMSSEPWVWLFADDDVMAPDCVETFHAASTLRESVDVVRFQTDTIDSAGNVIQENPSHPPTESGAAFILSRLRGERHSFVVEYVFRRETYDLAGGFAEYPAAWCADDASWFLFSKRGGICTLQEGRVGWRASDLNITDDNRSRQDEKLDAAFQFLAFVDVAVRPDGGIDSDEQWRRAQESWLIDQIRYLMPLGPSLSLAIIQRSGGRWHRTAPEKALLLLAWNVAALPAFVRSSFRRRFRS